MWKRGDYRSHRALDFLISILDEIAVKGGSLWLKSGPLGLIGGPLGLPRGPICLTGVSPSLPRGPLGLKEAPSARKMDPLT